MTVESELVDSSTTYASVSDVERYLRSYDIDTSSDPSDSDVQDLIAKASEKIDKRTNRAWRTRKVTDIILPVRTSKLQNNPDLRHRGSTYINYARDTRGLCQLPHRDLESVDKVVALTDTTQETLDTSGDNPDYRADHRGGSLRINAVQYWAAPFHSNQSPSPRPRAKVTYQYGRQTVPVDITEATAKLVVADIIKTDFYGVTLPSDTDVSPSSLSQSLEDDAWETVMEYDYTGSPM